MELWGVLKGCEGKEDYDEWVRDSEGRLGGGQG